MKKTVLTFLTVFSVLLTFGQTFEGKIVYSNAYKSKNQQIPDQQWQMMLGSTQEYFIKGGNYKSVANGQLMQWQLYINKDNKLYNKMSNSEEAIWNDGSIQGDEVLKTEVNKGVVEILGYKCDEVVLTCKSGVQKYYFSSKIAADPKLFVNHKFGNWYQYLSLSNALPLKMVVETAQFEMTSTATEVTASKLDDNLFQLPSGIQTVKSPY